MFPRVLSPVPGPCYLTRTDTSGPRLPKVPKCLQSLLLLGTESSTDKDLFISMSTHSPYLEVRSSNRCGRLYTTTILPHPFQILRVVPVRPHLDSRALPLFGVFSQLPTSYKVSSSCPTCTSHSQSPWLVVPTHMSFLLFVCPSTKLHTTPFNPSEGPGPQPEESSPFVRRRFWRPHPYSTTPHRS